MNVFQAQIKIKDLVDSVNMEYIGKKFRVLSNYNGQPYGRSRKSKKGQIFTVDWIGFDDGKAFISPKEERLCLGLDEIEFI